jgi:hypothetical protein
MTPLHHIGGIMRELLSQVPLPAVRLVFVAIPLVLLIWVLRLPREATTSPEGSGRWDANLKVWASVALLLQVLIYSVF